LRLLLINPKFPESFWSFKWAVEQILSDKRTVNPPLGLATLAALCPQDWQVTIIDENVESVPLRPEADLIGICGMGVQFDRQRELLTFYRQQGYFVIAGGSYASLCPEAYVRLADSVIAGESEYIWPRFCRDFEKRQALSLYQEDGEVDMTVSPVPRYDLLKLDRYQSVSLQFSRGCPFRCEFCDIIVMFGRKPRTKTLQQIGLELDLLRHLAVRRVFFVDDNLIGNKRKAKELMAYLRDYQQKHDYWFHFGTEATLNLAQDVALLQGFKQANFKWVFIGIESPDTESLKETQKTQNIGQDILTSVRTIYANGLEILAGFIIGFDNDTLKTFEKQLQFILKSGIQAAMVGLLTALPKTPLYDRLQREGRLRTAVTGSDNTKLATNVIPKQMNYDEMIEHYRRLYFELLEDKNIAARIKNKLKYLVAPPGVRVSEGWQDLTSLWRFVTRGLLAGDPARIYHFLYSIPITRPALIPYAIQDWILGLSMRDYVERHFVQEFSRVNAITQSYLQTIEAAFHRHLKHGRLEVSLEQMKHAAGNLSISLKGYLDGNSFQRILYHLENVLEDTASSITLHIEEFQEGEIKHLEQLLAKLARYGDRINITVCDKLRFAIEIDSSIFNLVLIS
jgi:radical SAM superfamily enzyme YgiQ (UPF0313 family)